MVRKNLIKEQNGLLIKMENIFRTILPGKYLNGSDYPIPFLIPKKILRLR